MFAGAHRDPTRQDLETGGGSPGSAEHRRPVEGAGRPATRHDRRPAATDGGAILFGLNIQLRYARAALQLPVRRVWFVPGTSVGLRLTVLRSPLCLGTAFLSALLWKVAPALVNAA